MPVLIVIDRTGTAKELSTKSFEEENLFKRAGFKTSNDFVLHHVFRVGTYLIHLYGKTKGKAGQENKYDFPPPVDNVLFFGSCLLVNKRRKEGDVEEVADLSLKEWEAIYEKLFGGFEDLATTEANDDDDELDITEEEMAVLNDPKTQFTKSGYVKDDFIVDDEDDDAEEGEEDDDYEEEDEAPLPKAKPAKKPAAKKPAAKKPAAKAVVEEEEETKPRNKARNVVRRPRKDTVVYISDEPDAASELLEELTTEEYFK